MSLFVKNHVSRIFAEGGYELVKIHGDRGGIVQGDGLHLLVSVDPAMLVRLHGERFLLDPTEVAEDARNGEKLQISLYGGSASANLEGVEFSNRFIHLAKEEAAALYYRAQNEVNAIFDAEDGPDRDWDGSKGAYVGVVDEFAVQPIAGDRSFIRVLRVADQSFNAYESGDEEADRADADGIIAGKLSHGTVEIHIYDIDPTGFPEDGDMAFDRDFSEDAYEAREFRHEEPARVISGVGLIWGRDEADVFTLELAAELADDEGEHVVANVIREHAIARGLQADGQEIENSTVARP